MQTVLVRGEIVDVSEDVAEDMLGLVASEKSPSYVLRKDYAALYKDPGRADVDPVVMRKGDTVFPAGKAQNGMVPVKIPQGFPVLSATSGYPAHAPIDYSATYWTREDNLETPPSQVIPVTVVSPQAASKPAGPAVPAAPVYQVEKTEGMSVSQWLQQNVGGLPVYGWGLIGIGALGILGGTITYLRRR